ncbi:MAG: 2'-deoxycytidine 5'-triphosphate deaminase [candidate division Zixibacteria bacterium]|nr:2'-deoxycytidine 5'-triphosphate deaminase [Candidatus Tariuqbacter arcticus]
MNNKNRADEITRPGILNKNQIIKLMDYEHIINGDKNHIGVSSFDLHLSKLGWKLDAGFKCRSDRTINEIIKSAKSDEFEIKQLTLSDSGLKLDRGKTYLFELRETINLPVNFWGQGTGRSSIGRLDVLTRLLADNEERYDVVTNGNKSLYVEITPLSFPIRVYPGTPIYQLRIAYGDFNRLRLQNDLLKLYNELLKKENGERLSGEDQAYLRLNLMPDISIPGKNKVVAFKAKTSDDNVIDLKKENEGFYRPEDYWEKKKCEITIGGNSALRIKKDDFYILRSLERFDLPDNIAVYGVAMTEEVGELRIHHAGFIHPRFGNNRKDNKGAPLIFEVRGHDIEMLLIHGDVMAELKYYPMSLPAPPPDKKDDLYSNQELTLSKYFGNWENED